MKRILERIRELRAGAGTPQETYQLDSIEMEVRSLDRSYRLVQRDDGVIDEEALAQARQAPVPQEPAHKPCKVIALFWLLGLGALLGLDIVATLTGQPGWLVYGAPTLVTCTALTVWLLYPTLE